MEKTRKIRTNTMKNPQATMLKMLTSAELFAFVMAQKHRHIQKQKHTHIFNENVTMKASRGFANNTNEHKYCQEKTKMNAQNGFVLFQ